MYSTASISAGLWRLQLWNSLAEKAHLKEKIEHMFDGTHLNVTEDRSVLHVALRAPRDYVSLCRRSATEPVPAAFGLLGQEAASSLRCLSSSRLVLDSAGVKRQC